jgi:hypothetical protein
MYQTRPIFIIYWEFVAKIYLYSQILFLLLLRTSMHVCMYECMHVCIVVDIVLNLYLIQT